MRRNFFLFYFFFIFSFFITIISPVLLSVFLKLDIQNNSITKQITSKNKDDFSTHFNRFFAQNSCLSFHKRLFRGLSLEYDDLEQKGKNSLGGVLEEIINDPSLIFAFLLSAITKNKKIIELKENQWKLLKEEKNNQSKKVEVELNTLYKIESELKKNLEMNSFFTFPGSYPYTFFLVRGIASLKEKNLGLFLVKTFFWFFIFSSFGVTFLFFSWLVDYLFKSSEGNGNDALVILSAPGINRKELIVAKILTLICFLTIFSVFLFSIPFAFFWFFFAASAPAINLLLLSLFMTFVAPTLFVLSFGSLFVFFSNLIPRKLYYSLVFIFSFIRFLPSVVKESYFNHKLLNFFSSHYNLTLVFFLFLGSGFSLFNFFEYKKKELK